jgi:HEAT repeat protein
MSDDSPAVVEALINAVGDDDSNVRIASANSIRQLVDDPVVLIPMVVTIMEQEHPLFASRMIETIVMRGEKAVPVVIAALKNERAAYWACLAIEELGETASDAVPGLMELLDSKPDDDVKVQALLALAKVGPKASAAQQQVITALEPSSSDSVLTAAAYAAGLVGFDEATPRLEETVNSGEPLLALVSRWAIAKLHPEDESRMKAAVDQLVASLGSDDASLRLAAAKGLQSLDVEPDVLGPRLIEMLNDSDPIVAHNLVDAIASLGEPVAERAGNALSNAEVRELAVRVLERLGPQAKSAVPDLVAAMASAEGEFRQQMQTVLGQIGPDAAPASGELIRSLSDDSDGVRISALLAIGRIGPEAGSVASKVEAFMVKTDDPFEKLLSAWAIAKISAKDDPMVAKIVPVLIEGLSFPDARVQAEAVSMLGSLGPAADKALDDLNALSNNESASIELRELAKEAAAAIR